MSSRILIIEDETTIAQLERDYFELNGFQVDLCHSGSEGLPLAINGDYSLIIVDLQLPGMDGFELCSQIRQVKEVPILIVSAKKKRSIKFAPLISVPMTILQSRLAPANWLPEPKPI